MQSNLTTIEPGAGESSHSAVSWAPVFAGSLAAASLTVLLTLLGSGLGLSVASPFGSEGVSLTTFAASTAIWLIIIQWLSAGFGGYLTGRLRTKWVGVHDDEIYFRDTAHGFLSWALATVVVAVMLSSALSSAIGGGVQAASTVVSGAASGAGTAAANADTGGTSYFVDTLLRPANINAAAGGDANTTEAQVTRILVNSATSGEMSEGDKTYLTQLVAARAGVSEADAQARVDQVLASVDAAKQQATEAAEAARKAAVTFSLVTALSLLIGAFIASIAAVLGGRERDETESRLSAR
ncbi:hypothetical protein ABFT80_02505 [Mesorhizobium sp. SB112]|uniref:hypothetical protein n=1 Tax=Mesorhizobium sp. SB112 TaxID=3151853 RepID=UPI003264731C